MGHIITYIKKKTLQLSFYSQKSTENTHTSDICIWVKSNISLLKNRRSLKMSLLLVFLLKSEKWQNNLSLVSFGQYKLEKSSSVATNFNYISGHSSLFFFIFTWYILFWLLFKFWSVIFLASCQKVESCNWIYGLIFLSWLKHLTFCFPSFILFFDFLTAPLAYGCGVVPLCVAVLQLINLFNLSSTTTHVTQHTLNTKATLHLRFFLQIHREHLQFWYMYL